MNILGHMVVIKRTGADGTLIPLTKISCSIGRNADCDIRVILPSVSSQHCQIDVDPCGKAYITNVSQCNHTLVNDSPLAGEEVCILGHKDIITIADRQFRWEYPKGSVLAVSVKKDQVMNYKIPSPTAKSRFGHLSFSGDSGGTKRKNAEAVVLLDMQEAKRKKVSFGPQLNPEHFDKLLPPASPVSKGEKPNTQSLPNISDSPCLNTNMRKSLRMSHTPVDKPTSEESVMDTPTKSLLRRRSPTPVKPYIARSLGLFAPKVPDTESSVKTHADESLKLKLFNINEGSVANGLTHDVPIVDNCPKISPEKSPRLMSLESKKTSELFSPKCLEAAMDSCKLSGNSKKLKSDSSRKLHKVIVSKVKKHSDNNTSFKSPKRCKSVIKSESPQNLTTSSMKYKNIQTLSKEGTHETSPKKVLVSKTSPKKAESPETPGYDFTQKVTTHVPSRKLKTPESQPRKLSPKTSRDKVATPEASKKLEVSRASQKQVQCPSTTPKKVSSPRATAKKPSPRATPKKVTSKMMPRKVTSPRGIPKVISSKVASCKTTTKKMTSPKATVIKVVTPKNIASPKSPSKRIASPKSSLKEMASPKSPSREIASPSRKMESPKSLPKKMASPESPSRKMESPKSLPKKMVSPESPSRKITSPKSPSRKIASPKSLLKKKVVSPPRRISSPKSVSKEVPLPESPKPTLNLITTPTKVSPKTTVEVKSPTFNSLAVDMTSPKITSPNSLSKTVVSPTSPPKTAASNISPTKVACFELPPQKFASSPSTPKKTLSPQVTPKSSPSKATSSKSFSKEALPRSPLKQALLNEVTALFKAQRSYPRAARHRKSRGSMTPKLNVTKRLIRTTAVTPKSGHKSSSKGKTPKKSWADVLKSGLMAHGIQQGKQVMPRTKAPCVTRKRKLKNKCLSVEVIKSLELGRVTTGHANSPAPIFIHEKTSKTPKLFKKGHKIPLRAEVSKLISNGDAYLDGLAGLMATPEGLKDKQITSATSEVDKTPKCSGEITSPKTKRRCSRVPVVSNQDNEMVKIQGISPKPVKKTRSLFTKTPEFSISDKDPGSLNKSLAFSPTEVETLREPSALDFEESVGDSLDHSSPTASNVPSVGERPLSYISTSTSYMNTTNFDFSSVKTPDVTEDNYVSPLVTPATLKTSEHVLRSYEDKPLVTPPKDIPLETDVTTFDFENVHTPNFSKDHFVSPMSTNCKHTTPRVNYSFRKSPRNHDLSGMKILSMPESKNEMPKGTHPDVHEIKRLLCTPKTAFSTPRQRNVGLNVSFETNITGIDESSAQNRTAGSETEVTMAKVEKQLRNPNLASGSPKADHINNTDVGYLTETVCATAKNSTENDCAIMSDVKLQMTPKLILSNIRTDDAEIPKADYTNVAGVKKLMKTPDSDTKESPKADYTNVRGVKKLLKTPKADGKEHEADYTNVVGVRRLLQTPKPRVESPKANYTDVSGVKRLMKMPNITCQESPEADYTNVRGVKKLMKTPGKEHEANYTYVAGVRKLLQTPKPRVESPKADYTDVSGVKRLMKTPNATRQKSPEADYTNVAGVKKLMRTPKAPVPEHEANDTHVIGIRKILRSPKLPSESPKADYTNVVGVKRLFKIPNKAVPKQCTADYSNVAGIKRLLRSPRQTPTKETEVVLSLQKNFKTQRKTSERIPDYREPKGLKRLLATPKQKQFSPLSDYTNVAGLKNILATPQSPIKSPKADYTNVYGVRALMRTPKIQDDFVDVDVDGLGQLLKTPLTDQTNVVVSRAVELAKHSSDQGSGRKLRRSPKVTSPATSSPSENIPPLEEIRRNAEALQEQVQDGGSTPRRSQRNAKVKVQQVTTPVRRGRSRKVTTKEPDSIESDVDGSVLKLIKASPVVPERRLRSRKGVCHIEESPTGVIQKKSKRTPKTNSGRSKGMDLKSQTDEENSVQTKVVEHKHYDNSVDEANKVATKKKQHSSPKKVNSVEVNSDNSSQLQVDCSPLPGGRCNDKCGDLDLPMKTRGRRGKQTTLISKEDLTEPTPLIVEDTTPVVFSSGNDIDLKSKESVTTRKRRNQIKTETPRGHGRKKAAKGNDDGAEETNKVEAQSVHDDKPFDTGRLSPGFISENKPTPHKLRKVQDGELECIQVTEISCQIQEPSKKEKVPSRRDRNKAAEKPENESKRQLRGRKNCSKQTSRVQESEQESDTSPNGYTVSSTILKDSASECQTTKRKRGNNKLNSKIVHEIATEESSEDLVKSTEKKQKSSSRSSNKKVKNQDLACESIKNEVKDPDLPQQQTRLTRSKKDTDTVETLTHKRRVQAMTGEVETTRVTRSRNKSTKTEDLPAKVTRQTRSCK